MCARAVSQSLACGCPFFSSSIEVFKKIILHYFVIIITNSMGAHPGSSLWVEAG